MTTRNDIGARTVHDSWPALLFLLSRDGALGGNNTQEDGRSNEAVVEVDKKGWALGLLLALCLSRIPRIV